MLRAAGLCLVWSISVASLFLPDAERWISGLSRTGLCALPWIIYLGLPRVASRHAAGLPSTTARASTTAWLALPPLALSARVDIAAGLETRAVLLLAAASAILATLALWAATMAARERRAAAVHAIAWLALVMGTPLLCAALERGGATSYGAAPRWLTALAGASPLQWMWRQLSIVGGRAATDARAGDASVFLPLGTCALLVLLARARRAAPAGAEH
jgi:hypothetical protein